jgi:hypothetical protein
MMRARAQTESSGPSVAGAADGDPAARLPDAAGRLLGRLSVLPALLIMAWLLAGLPLLLAGAFTPALTLLLSVPLAAALVVLGLRWTPGRRQDAEPAPGPEQARTPWWAVVGVIAVAFAFGVDQLVYHSQFIIVTRDPASYFQFGNWIAHHGSLPIGQDRAAFGGTHHVLGFASFAYYQVGSTVVPQFMAGLPMLLAPAFWAGGAGAAVTMGAVFGAAAVLTFGGLAARLAGPRWAPLGALILALALPEQFVSRSTFSEPVAQILFLGGLCLVIDSLRVDGVAAKVIAAIGGLALGLTLLVRIDGAADILPVIPYCGILLIGRRRQALPLVGGLAVGVIYGVVDGLVLSRPYLSSIKSSIVPLVLLTGLVVVATLIAMALLWDKGLPAVRGKWLPNAVAALVVVVMIGFALRPYVQTVRAKSSAFFGSIMASYQRADHIPVQPERLYYELSLHWVFWYIGLPAVVLATAGAALISRRCLRGQAPAWTLPLMIFAWAIVATLYKPAITPDHPWASRRLVPAVLPGFIVLAVWAGGWLSGWLRRTGTARVVQAGVMVCCVAALVLPAAVTTFGLKVKGGGPVGIRLTAHGLATARTYQGEIAAVNRLCAAIPRDASVVFLGGTNGGDASRLTQVVRGICGVPAAHISSPRPQGVERVLRGIEQAGRRPVLLAGTPSRLVPYGGQIRMIMNLHTTQDENALTAPPTHTLPLDVPVWMSEPAL